MEKIQLSNAAAEVDASMSHRGQQPGTVCVCCDNDVRFGSALVSMVEIMPSLLQLLLSWGRQVCDCKWP